MSGPFRSTYATAAVIVAVLVVGPTALPRQQSQAAPPGGQGKVQPKPISPAEQAFRDALAVRDRQERLRAFQKLLTDWPDSPAVKNGAADFNILGLACAAEAAAAREARRAADACIAKLPPGDRNRLAFQHFMMAMQFMRADSLWADAERHARKSLEYWDSRRTTLPTNAVGVDLERAVVTTILGQAVAKQGRDDEAEPFLREAYQARADEPGVVGQVVPLLLAIARRHGRADEQVEYLTALALYGGLTPELRKELEESYRRSHNGSLDGLEAMLDARYESELPKAIVVEPFDRKVEPGARTVLAEMFTGSSCAPCVGMDLALEAAQRRYQPRDLAVLVYHLHSPAPDPLANPSALARAKAYGFGGGVPHVLVDGLAFDAEGGGKAAEAGSILRSRLQPAIERAMTVPAGARVAVQVARTGDIVRARVTADHLSKGTAPVRLQVALVEERVRYSGGNGIRFHPMVVRKLAGDGAGLPIWTTGQAKNDVVFDMVAIRRELKTYLDEFEAGKSDFGPYTFVEKKHDLDGSRLLVVAFVQEEGTRRVLQSALTRVPVR